VDNCRRIQACKATIQEGILAVATATTERPWGIRLQVDIKILLNSRENLSMERICKSIKIRTFSSN
jgi:hypothetical protein